ncbi:MAG: Nif3-like dinuclear metal center hexameric protein [Deltaproteobacteria bacterium]|nr:Nif3-like dinuclear metal center hexameric protein [Deltaproteobacteria bacterium]
MVPTLSHIQQVADRMFPFSCAEPWDNSGVQVGDLSRAISSIAFSLNASVDAVRFASVNNCDLLISHHPVFLNPIKKILASDTYGKVILMAAAASVDIMSLHTNLDAAAGGLNDFLTEMLGLEDAEVPNNAPSARLARLPKSHTVFDLAQTLCRKLNLDSVRIIGPLDKVVSSVFIVSGSGMGYLDQAILAKADVMVTGDVRYHSALDSQESDISVIDAGHFGLEKCVVELMRDKFEEQFLKLGWEIKLCPFRGERNPFADIRFEG